MGCHPKPIDFHSIIFQDGKVAPPTSSHVLTILLTIITTINNELPSGINHY